MMKTIFCTDGIPKTRILNIYIEFSYAANDIAAGEYINKRNVKAKYQLSDDELVLYDDFIRNVIHALKSKHFNILKNRQANNTYSYYISFKPVSESGEEFDRCAIILRISNHIREGSEADSIEDNDSQIVYQGRAIISSIIIGTKKYSSYMQAVDRVYDIVDELAIGNYDILFE